MFKNRCKGLLIVVLIASSLSCATHPRPHLTREQEVARYHVVLGLNDLKQNQLVSAKQKLVKAVNEAPRDPLVLDAMGYYYEKTGNMTQAKTYYDRALQVAPTSPEAENNYGTYLCRQGKPKQAIQYFMKAAHQPEYLHTAQAYENAGQCALKAGQAGQARHYLQQALKHDPMRPYTLLLLTQLSYNDQQYCRAASYLDRLQRIDPQSPKIHQWRVKIDKAMPSMKKGSHCE